MGQSLGAPLGGGSSITATGALRYTGYFNAVGYKIQAYPAVCNYWVDIDIYDSGHRYFHSQGTEVKGCISVLAGRSAIRKFNADYILRPNSEVCATLWRWKGSQIVGVAKTCAVTS